LVQDYKQSKAVELMGTLLSIPYTHTGMRTGTPAAEVISGFPKERISLKTT